MCVCVGGCSCGGVGFVECVLWCLGLVFGWWWLLFVVVGFWGGFVAGWVDGCFGILGLDRLA